MSEDRARLFVAVPIAHEVRLVVERATAALRAHLGRAVSWTPTEKLHLTLRFLGDQPREMIPALAEALRRAAASVSRDTLHLAAFGAFPRLERPRVLWFGLAANVALARLYQEVDSACDSLGLGREPRPFAPHLTIGRVRPHAHPVATPVLPPLDVTTPLDAVELMESRLARSGAQYTCLASLPLAAREVH